ncbi:MAG: 2,3-bisphosphoglycerate-independent phosphoglycerate mutase [Candidatus Dormibacteraeota bacterium]|uniref:2,3-bisphosphoglycerate-independent phosphoglycerate mutase n=1 Tax=Candidatus Amunia macphersoniae TaxID=3127014 RepID=A0A934KKC4_9BACT|nr:2,3-bisphosphoglycerate-independent phosphoglycerate mutase [Candidatus Dormibacteraeota bacterium]
MSRARPFVLAILDGWGCSEDRFGNAIAAASTPTMDRLIAAWPSATLAASGEAVGLPAGQQGNSEVGHLTIGAGRVILQPLTRINRAIADGSFFENPVLCKAVDIAIQRGTSMHCLGLVSPGGVHSEQAHGVALAELARRRGLQRVWFDAFTDGRDEPPSSAAGFMRAFTADLDATGCGELASVSGRYYAMDRDTRWERTERAYDQLVGSAAAAAADPVAYIEAQYGEGVTDEFLAPVSMVSPGGGRVRIDDGDSVVFFNFRPDRARQLSQALVESDFRGFARSRVLHDLHLVTFTEYSRELAAEVAFPRQDVTHTLAEEVSAAGLRQFHVAETEKYAHVTYFINGGRELQFPGEDRLLVPSPRVATYEQTPAMSAAAITDAVVEHIHGGEDALIVLNFANPDMVGHTGLFDATVEAVEVVDSCLDRIDRAVLAAGGGLLITADHGNAEHKIDAADNSPLTAHTTSPVPVILCGTDAADLRAGGGLEDVAPTVLRAMGLTVPEAMTGRPLC